MSFAAALILAASAPSQALPAPVPGGVRAMATVSVTIVSAARVRLDGASEEPGAANGDRLHVLHQRRLRGGRVLFEFD